MPEAFDRAVEFADKFIMRNYDLGAYRIRRSRGLEILSSEYNVGWTGGEWRYHAIGGILIAAPVSSEGHVAGSIQLVGEAPPNQIALLRRIVEQHEAYRNYISTDRVKNYMGCLHYTSLCLPACKHSEKKIMPDKEIVFFGHRLIDSVFSIMAGAERQRGRARAIDMVREYIEEHRPWMLTGGNPPGIDFEIEEEV